MTLTVNRIIKRVPVGENTEIGGNSRIINIQSAAGKDHQLVSFSITFENGILANTLSQILNYTGAGYILAIQSFLLLAPDGSIIDNNPSAIGASGSATFVYQSVNNIPANSVMNLILCIGNY